MQMYLSLSWMLQQSYIRLYVRVAKVVIYVTVNMHWIVEKVLKF